MSNMMSNADLNAQKARTVTPKQKAVTPDGRKQRNPKPNRNSQRVEQHQACYLEFLCRSGGTSQQRGYAAQSWDLLTEYTPPQQQHLDLDVTNQTAARAQTSEQWPPQRQVKQKQNKEQWPPQRQTQQNKSKPAQVTKCEMSDAKTPQGAGVKVLQRDTTPMGEAAVQQGQPGSARSGRPKGKKQVFEQYWEGKDVSDGLKRGHLIQGALRKNPRNYEECFVPHPDGVSDVFVSGTKDRNRALNGDEVAVLLHPRDQWKVLVDNVDMTQGSVSWLHNEQDVGDKLEKLTLDEAAAAAKSKTPNKGSQSAKKTKTATPNNRHVSLRELCTPPGKQRLSSTRKEPDADSGDGEKVLQDRMSSIPDNCLLRTGKIVAIVEPKHSRASTGSIRLMQDRNPRIALFVPKDHRFPRLMVPMTDCPKDFLTRPDDHQSTLFIGRLTEWPEDSNYPKGRLARSLGEAGLIEPETEGILVENGVDYAEFPEAAIECLPKDLPWRIPESEFEYRKDLRKECIFTIDPATARDLDDALHCTKLDDGTYEIGVHIADVSFFIDERNALDKIAASRATSVYLVQKVIPMLPRLLCEQLCSLNPDEDRLAFSVIWKMTETGEIYDEWFGRSIIRSCAKLSYEHAQGFIEEPERTWSTDELPPVSEGFSIPMIVERVLNLHKVAVHLRKKRFDGGALRLDQVKLSFALDSETGLPCGYSVYQQKESNRLIEEFMLLANMAVAHKIYKAFPEVAMLRRHPPPQEKQLDDLVALCKTYDIELDATSAGALQRSLQQHSGETPEQRAKLQVIIAMTTKPMQNARYFCTGCIDDEEVFRHYALNVPLYTHFTSPIRRYPDVVVHRLLAAALGLCDAPSRSKGEVQAQAENCNDKKWASKRAQEASSDLFFAVFVKECGPLEEKGVVMGVLDKAFDVLVLSLGVVKRVYCNQLPLETHSFRKDHKRPELTLVWKDKHEQLLTIFSEVGCVLTADPDSGPLRWKAVIKHPGKSTANI